MRKNYKITKEKISAYGNLSESDTRVKIIDPQLRESGWVEENIKREFYLKKGKIIIEGNQAKRGEKKFVDYLLFYNRAFPIAVIEAKGCFKHYADGISDAKRKAKILGLNFAYSTNGEKFEEFDFSTNKQTTLDKFPSPKELYKKWYKITIKIHPDFSKIPTNQNPFLIPLYYDPQKVPRYYQLTAINKVLEAILNGQQRIVLTMATGTGKTYIASQIVYKLWESGYLKKILYLTDRAEVLRDQAYNEFRGLGDARDKIIEGKTPRVRDIYFATYQTLYSGDENKRLYQKYPPDFFDLIIIDECHRSGWYRWYEILQYFKQAIHFGMTATPKRKDNIDTYKYFGNPIYEYDIEHGIEDGYLANYQVQRIFTNLDKEGIKLKEAELQGAEIYVPKEEDIEIKIKEIYKTPSFEKTISLPDRTKFICQKIAELLERYDPMDKSIIYCVNIDHAQDVKKELQNHFAHLGYSNYAVRIVAEDQEDKKELENFKDSEKQLPVIATTVDLLTTGVDIPPVKNIIFLKTVSSLVLFNQIIGRGTRIDEASGKMFFRIIDFTGATRLLPDLEKEPPLPKSSKGPFDYFYKAQIFDAKTGKFLPEARAVIILGPHKTIIKKSDQEGLIFFNNLPRTKIKLIIEKSGYNKKQLKIQPRPNLERIGTIILTKKRKRHPIKIQGIDVYVKTEEDILIEAGGRKLNKAEYREYSKEGIRKRVNLEDLRKIWLDDEKREEFLKKLLNQGISSEIISSVILKRSDIDDFDVLTHIAFDAPIISRDERAMALLGLKQQFVISFSLEGREVIMDLIEQYRLAGIEELQPDVFKIHRFVQKYGGIKSIIERLKIKNLAPVFNQLKENIYGPANFIQ